MANRWENHGNSDRLCFLWLQKSLQMVTAAMKWKDACSLEEKLWHRQHIKKRRHYFANKGLSIQGYAFSCSHVWMWELDHKEGWALKNWHSWTVVLENRKDSWESPGLQEIKQVNPKVNQPWIFIGRTDAEAEASILGPPDAKSRLIRKDPDDGNDWRQEEQVTTENKMVGWHH